MTVSCLIVDDSEDFLASATRLLSLQGIRIVGQASSGIDALKLAEALRPDLVLVDVGLGQEDGIELTRQLTSCDSPAIVILISIRDRDEFSELVPASGAAGFLRKDALDAEAVTGLMIEQRRRAAGPGLG